MQAIGGALGQGAEWLGSNIPNFLGGSSGTIGQGLQNWGQGMIPPSAAELGGAMQYTSDPGVSSYFGADPGSTPTSLAGPIATAIGPTGGVGANPAQMTESAFSALPQATDPVTGGQLGPALGDPASSLTSGVLNALGLGGGGGGAAAGGRSPLAGDLGILAAGGTDLLKYLQQRQLLNPSSIASATQQMMNKNAKALRKAIFPQVTAQLQETGNINAPYLASQAYTTAIAPTLANEQMAAMEDWLRANAEAEGLYPSNQDIGALGGFVSPNTFGGGYA